METMPKLASNSARFGPMPNIVSTERSRSETCMLRLESPRLSRYVKILEAVLEQETRRRHAIAQTGGSAYNP